MKDEFSIFWSEQGCLPPSTRNYWFHSGPFAAGPSHHPAGYLSIHIAKEFASWAGYRLPTPEEWEKAARGVDGRLYPWGNDWDPTKCNVTESKIGHTVPVDAYPEGRSPYGCMNMAGNVWEVTSKIGHSSIDSDEDYYIAKGGSFHDGKSIANCVYNYDLSEEAVGDYIGFRYVVENPGPKDFEF